MSSEFFAYLSFHKKNSCPWKETLAFDSYLPITVESNEAGINAMVYIVKAEG